MRFQDSLIAFAIGLEGQPGISGHGRVVLFEALGELECRGPIEDGGEAQIAAFETGLTHSQLGEIGIR